MEIHTGRIGSGLDAKKSMLPGKIREIAMKAAFAVSIATAGAAHTEAQTIDDSSLNFVNDVNGIGISFQTLNPGETKEIYISADGIFIENTSGCLPNADFPSGYAISSHSEALIEFPIFLRNKLDDVLPTTTKDIRDMEMGSGVVVSTTINYSCKPE